MAESFKFCCCVPVDSIHIIAGKNGDNLEKMSDEIQTLVTLQSCEDAQSGSNERIIRLGLGTSPYHNLRRLQSSVSTSENLIQMTTTKPAVIAKRREEKREEKRREDKRR